MHSFPFMVNVHSNHMHWLRTYLVAYCLFFCFPLVGQQLSPDATISLLTYSPSSQLYTAFGHSALRVKDPTQSMDRVYNYGTFDFEEPGFYLKFMRGKLNYKLSAYDFRYVELEQQQRQMNVREQVFNLTQEQKQALFDFLNNNALPENRFYLYDFFYDNCATRIRDAFQVVLGESLQLDTTFVLPAEQKTFRQLIDEYLDPQPWADFGIDLALGARIDQTASPYEYMFLPDYLAEGLGGSTLTRDGQTVPLVKRDEIIMAETQEMLSPTEYMHPRWTFIALFAVFLVWTIITRKQKPVHWPDITLFTAIGLLGTLLLILWLATDHQTTKENWNLLWAHPLHLLTAVLLARNKLGVGAKLYFLISGFFYLGLIAGSEVISQEYHPAVIPLIALIAFRYFYKYHQINLPRQVPPASVRASW
ncbi:MAG: DUF4105 domain-containing protein [Bacteroidota bacterium]